MRKKALIVVFCLLLSHQPYYAQVEAENVWVDGYLRVTDYTTPIFKDKFGQEFLFYLPYSYYVKIIKLENDMAHVECFGGELTPLIDGYVWIDDLTDHTAQAQTPYLDYTVTTSQATILYADPDCTTSLRVVFADRKLGYYGCADQNEYVYFVCYMGYTGYVKEDGLKPFTTPLHPDPIITQPETLPEEQRPTTQAKDYTGLKTAIIICLLMAGVIGLFSVLKKKTAKGVAATYYDDADYE